MLYALKDRLSKIIKGSIIKLDSEYNLFHKKVTGTLNEAESKGLTLSETAESLEKVLRPTIKVISIKKDESVIGHELKTITRSM